MNPGTKRTKIIDHSTTTESLDSIWPSRFPVFQQVSNLFLSDGIQMGKKKVKESFEKL